MRLRILILSLCLAGVNALAAYEKTVTDSLMRQLDEVIANRSVYLGQKELRLRELRIELENSKDDRARFDALNHLYDEYHAFNADSAYNISKRQEEIGERVGDPCLVAQARMNRASILSATGMYHETIDLLDSIKMEEIPQYLQPYYFHIKRTVYGLLADFAAFGTEKEIYNRLTNMYRDSIMDANDTHSLAHVITKADYLNVNGNPQEAVRLLKQFMTDNNLSEHEKAICAWTLSESYARLGDTERRKEQLLISSISDLRSSVREYMSLRELALLLYEEGDLGRAHKFMSIAVDDATKCNARQRIVELNDSFPKINGIYVDTVERQKDSLKRTIWIITILSMILLILIFLMRKQMQKTAKARKEIEEAYVRLNKVTEELKATNESLSDANSSIAEISELKEVYIGRYMDQCLVYIDKLDSYRKSIGKLLSSNKVEDLKKLVKSTSMIDDDLKAFYEQFDKTFLSLFPTFVEDFNGLLLPEEKIIPKRPGSLTTELRIFALIRLGITDSDSIAKFLRYSLTTIYNYRTKVRNKAAGDRNMLEAEVMKIGRSRHDKA